MDLGQKIADNFRIVNGRIAEAARRSGRNSDQVKLIVVTKGHPVEIARLAVDAGASRLGENYPEEGARKRISLSSSGSVEWHMIGHVQSRKAELISQNYEWLHSLDSIKLASRLNRFLEIQKKRLPVLIEINVSGEKTKSGFEASDQHQWELIVRDLKTIADFPWLAIRGLMTMPPLFDDPEKARGSFRRLVEFRDYVQKQVTQCDWNELSMGMSSDYEVAIEEGATFVRIGQAIVGPRPQTKGEL